MLQEFEFENTASTGHRDQQGMADEIIRLRDEIREERRRLGKLEERRCGAGHENVLPLRLWDCPTCHNETRKRLADWMERHKNLLATLTQERELGDIAKSELEAADAELAQTKVKLKQTDIDLGKAERRYEAAEAIVSVGHPSWPVLECPDCDGAGTTGTAPNGKSYSCETCGGHEDSAGRGWVRMADADALEASEKVRRDVAKTIRASSYPCAPKEMEQWAHKLMEVSDGS